MDAAARSLPVDGTRPWNALARRGAFVAFFVALACSISVSQALLATLVLLAIPWRALGAPPGARAGPGPWLARAWEQAAPLRRHPLTRPFAAFAALTLVSASLSGNPGWSFWIARDLLRIATFYVVWRGTRDAEDALRLWQAFLLTLTLMATYGLGQAYLCGARPGALPGPWLAEVCTHPERIRGPFSIYMTFGGVLLLGALFLLAALANLPWRRAWWAAPAGAVMAGALALTYSRNAWLGLAVGGLALVATARRRVRLPALVVGALAAGLLAVPGPVSQRALSIANPQDPTARDRVAMWRAGLAMIADRPLFGVGPGEVRAWYQHYRRPEAIRPSTGHLHNSTVQIAAERGLLALGAWIWLWVVFFREAGRVLARLPREPSPARALVSASLAGVTGFLVAGLFEHNFGDGEVVMVIYALMALPWVVAGAGTPRRDAGGRVTGPGPSGDGVGATSRTAPSAADEASRTSAFPSWQAA
jgi:O-antigen ligase